MQRDFVLEPADTERLANLTGPFDAHLRQIELRLGVEIANRGNMFRVTGEDARGDARAERVLRELYDDDRSETLTGAQINLRLAESGIDALDAERAPRRAGRRDQGQARHVRGRGAEPGSATCTRSPPTTSTSASVRPAPARPISRSRWRSTR